MKFLLLLLLLASCTNSPNTGVTTFPNSIKGKVINNDVVTVTLSQIEVKKQTVVNRTYTTQTINGEYAFEAIPSGKYIAVFKDKSGSYSIENISVEDNQNYELPTKENFDKYYLRGSINTEDALISIPGIGEWETSEGNFIIEAPSGKIPIFISSKNQHLLDISIFQNFDDTLALAQVDIKADTIIDDNYQGDALFTAKPVDFKAGEEPKYYKQYSMDFINYHKDKNFFNKLILDDFEHKSYPRGRFFDLMESWWYQTSDDNTILKTEEILNENGNNYLSITKTFANDLGPLCAYTILTLGREDFYDISKADSLKLRLKGEGLLEVSLHKKTEINIAKINADTINLQNNWTDYSISVEKLLNEYIIKEDPYEIKTLNFRFILDGPLADTTTLNFSIDDIILTETTIFDLIN